MSFVSIIAVSLLAAASPSAAAAAPVVSPLVADDVQSVAFTNSAPPAFTNSAPAAPATAPATAAPRDKDQDKPKGKDKDRDKDRDSGRTLSTGNHAPDFQYQSYDGMWQHLHNVLEHGDMVLVFGASDVDLRTLERERESLLKAGVMPLAVVEKNDRDVWASVRRLGLTYSLLADPKGAIGAQYGVFDPGIGRSRSAWFVIDVKGRVRQIGGELPAQGWPALAATALGRPLEGATQAASKR